MVSVLVDGRCSVVVVVGIFVERFKWGFFLEEKEMWCKIVGKFLGCWFLKLLRDGGCFGF